MDQVEKRSRSDERRWLLRAATIVLALAAAQMDLPLHPTAQTLADSPTGLVAALVDGVVTLDWSAPGIDPDSVTEYQVLRRRPLVDDIGVFDVIVDRSGSNATTYRDCSANEAGGAYTYRVKAWRGAELSGQSSFARIDLAADFVPPANACDEPDDDQPSADNPPVTDNSDPLLENSQIQQIQQVQQVQQVQQNQLNTLVANLDQFGTSFASLGDVTRKVIAQGFTTGSNEDGYLLQGIGVDIEGSDDNGSPQVPDGPSSVLVSVHADSNGSPGAKLFDLVSPDEFAPGVSFFEAPPDMVLKPDTSYVVVWRHLDGTWHRLVQTTSDDVDSGGLIGFSIADSFRSGAEIGSLSESSGGFALQIAVYGNDNETVSVTAPLPAPPRVTSFDLHSHNAAASDIWGNAETIWISDRDDGKLYAYQRSDGSRDPDKDFDDLDADNDTPSGFCSPDGQTMYVAESGENKLYAYKMSDQSRDSAKDITTDTANQQAEGVACSPNTIWVVEDDLDSGSDNKLYAYLIADGTRQSGLEFDTLVLGADATEQNHNPRGPGPMLRRCSWSTTLTTGSTRIRCRTRVKIRTRASI